MVQLNESDSLAPNVSWRLNSYWNQGQYDDSNLCSNDSKKIVKLTQNGDYLFIGSCADGKVWEGKIFFYDLDGILVKIELWKKGSYVGIGQL